MVFFITFLRALAACFITNAHYTGIYPIDLIANGGLIGDVLFFAVSGYCLYNVKGNFPRWYGKRLIRVYVPVLLMTTFFLMLGAYVVSTDRNLAWWLIYPTYYHFVASIIVLYIPFFIVMKVDVLKKNIPIVALAVLVVYVIVYVAFYDKTRYHIDTVREPMIRFLFFESMLLGAWFKKNDAKYRNQFRAWLPIATVFVFVAYFASKLLFSKRAAYCNYQILNQLIIFVLLYLMFRLFASLDRKLDQMPRWLKKIVTFIADITLEIYLVQYVLIDVIRNLKLPFPINWMAITASIILSAFILHTVCKPIVGKLSGVVDVKRIGDKN